jgi:ACS family tartrate transporter-like MFS transporter
LINSIGNLGGFWGPVILGEVKTLTGSFVGGLYCLSVSMFLSATLLFFLGLGKRSAPATVPAER